MTADSPILYEPSTDTLRVELRPWLAPAPDRRPELAGGQDAGRDLVIHYGPDGLPYAWEIEHASKHPEHIAAALAALRAAAAYKDAAYGCGQCRYPRAKPTTALRKRLIKIGARIVRRSRCIVVKLPAVALPRRRSLRPCAGPTDCANRPRQRRDAAGQGGRRSPGGAALRGGSTRGPRASQI